MREIRATNTGKIILVSDEDFEMLSKYSWITTTHGYALTSIKSKNVYMHRMIFPAFSIIDHKDRNGLNNQRNNLKESTPLDNARNRAKKGESSKYRGVNWHKPRNKWRVRLKVFYNSIHIGLFEDEFEAAKAYDIAAKFWYGNSALLNFPSL